MSGAIGLLDRLRSADVAVAAEGPDLKIEAPVGVLTAELVAEVRESKADLLGLVEIDAALDAAMAAESPMAMREALRRFDAAIAADLLVETGIGHRAVARLDDSGALVVKFEPLVADREEN